MDINLIDHVMRSKEEVIGLINTCSLDFSQLVEVMKYLLFITKSKVRDEDFVMAASEAVRLFNE